MGNPAFSFTYAISAFLFLPLFSSLDLKRRSVDLSNPYSSYFGVSRSRTTPNIQSYPSSTNSDETAESLVSLPPPPPNAQRPLSTFIDTSNKNVDSLQVN